ncbi:MAG: aminoglycoside adenylyltransferase domain-containing protein [Dehalococcoidales bacterium]|jgi:predicted nucleotidyltransferase
MSPEVFSPTLYPYVNEVLKLFRDEAQATLGEYFLGMYLHGSLALGDFTPGHSDIDFVVVTTAEPPESITPALEAMHQRIHDGGLAWAGKLEGAYFPVSSIYRFNTEEPPRPHVWNRKFFTARPESDWLINFHILREHGVTVAGPPIRPLIMPITPDDIKRAVVEGLRVDWAPRLDDRAWLTPPGNQPFVVLTNCRSLYTLKYGTVKSKPAAAGWALKTLGKRWQGLIKDAMTWHQGMPPGDIEATLAMMKYTWDRAKACKL